MHRRVIYQALAWVPIAAGSATIAFTTTSHQVINKAVVYEPTTTYAQAIVAAAETITADKWYQPLSTPVRRPPLGAARLNIVQTATPLAADIKADMWWRQLDLPVRRRQITAEEGSIFAAPARPEANDQQAWYRPLGEPQRIKRSLYAQLTSSYAYFLPVVAETITVDKWYRPLDLPMRERRRITDQQELAAPVLTPEAFPGNATIAFASNSGMVVNRTDHLRRYGLRLLHAGHRRRNHHRRQVVAAAHHPGSAPDDHRGRLLRRPAHAASQRPNRLASASRGSAAAQGSSSKGPTPPPRRSSTGQ